MRAQRARTRRSPRRARGRAGSRRASARIGAGMTWRCLSRSGPARRPSWLASRAASGASSSNASGLPPVALYKRSSASCVNSSPESSSAASARSRPATRSVRRSAPSSSEGWPSRTVRTSAIGSARNRRAANSRASALDAIEPMRVVHEQCERPLLRARGQQAERRGPDRKPVSGARGTECKRPGERARLRRRYPVQGAQGGTQQLGQPSERDHRLRLDSAASKDPHPVRARGRMLEQGGLPDPRLPYEPQHPTAAVSRLCKQAIERQPLVSAAKQHRMILASSEP